MNKPKNLLEFKNACKKIKLLLFDCDGVFTDGRIILGSNQTELKCFYTLDGIGLQMWARAGFLFGCVTGRASEALKLRAKELDMHELHQSVAKKGEKIEEIAKKRGLLLDEIAFVGDDVNDISAGLKVGLFFVPANHHYLIKPYADYVLKTAGGYGAIREVTDLLLTQKDLMGEVLKHYY